MARDDADKATDEPVAAGYAEAISELDGLLADLEDDALDIDLLAAKVERASALIRFCRSRISAARVQVDRIVADLEQPDESPPTHEPDDTDESET